MEDTFSVPDAPPKGTPDYSIIMTHGVHLWQWQWSIVEGAADVQYTAKANSHYLFSPNDPDDGQPKRPCCFPGQELSLWYPFSCRSQEGFLPGAESAVHCMVGAPASATAHISDMSTTDVATWLGSLGLHHDYSSLGINGKALERLALMVDKAAINHGDQDVPMMFQVIVETFGMTDDRVDAWLIMAGLSDLITAQNAQQGSSSA
jgi:hypothetical protein